MASYSVPQSCLREFVVWYSDSTKRMMSVCLSVVVLVVVAYAYRSTKQRRGTDWPRNVFAMNDDGELACARARICSLGVIIAGLIGRRVRRVDLMPKRKVFAKNM